MARDDEIWVHPATRASEPVPAWREALVPRALGLLLIAALVFGIVEIGLHFRLAGG